MFSPVRLGRFYWLVWLLAVTCWSFSSQDGLSQSAKSQSSSTASPSAESATTESTLEELQKAASEPKPVDEKTSQGIDFLSLLVKGGIFMIPIAVVSLFVVMFVFERIIGLRGGKLVPMGLLRKLRQLIRESESVDPRVAYGYCSDYPSATSNVVQAVLLRAGRPQAEVEATAREVSQREADKAYVGVRWLYFFASVAPLLGLLGTVWGLIRAFHDLTLLGPMQSRAEFLGRGIYEALVTTLAGLVVAIPAAVAAHYFEGRILRVFRNIEELVFNLIPKLERYEGRVRFDPIGRELISRSIDPARKTSTASVEGAKSSIPPVQGAVITTNSPHAGTTTPIRKSITKP